MDHLLPKSSDNNTTSTFTKGITMPLRIKVKRPRWGRNISCICGSGKKFKRCCWDYFQELNRVDGNVTMVEP
jgi:uncharacterized protein YchJ